jgi:hypothetical protein
LISGIDVAYSEGFNPMPRIETTQPLAIAIESHEEVASVMLASPLDAEIFKESVNRHLPEGIFIEKAIYLAIVPGKKLWSIGSLEWGSDYRIGGSAAEETLALSAKIRQRILDLELPVSDAQVDYDEDDKSIAFRLRLPKRKECGLLRILEACLDDRPVQSHIRVRRTGVYADAGDGEPISFFDAYAKLN